MQIEMEHDFWLKYPYMEIEIEMENGRSPSFCASSDPFYFLILS